MSLRIPLTLLLGSSLFIAPAIHSQQFNEQVNVTAVELIAEVVDESGRVPDDLKPDDLIVLEDGVERPVIGIERLTTAEPPPHTTSERPAAPKEQEPRRAPWQIVVYFDQHLTSILTIRKAARSLHEQAARLAALGTVEIIAADTRPRRLLEPTHDVARIEAALDEAAALPGYDRLARFRRVMIEDPPRHETELVMRVRQEIHLLRNFRDDLASWISSYPAQLPRALFLVSDGHDLDPAEFYLGDGSDSGVAARLRVKLREFQSRGDNLELARALAVGGWTTLSVRYGIPASFSGEASQSGDGRLSAFLGRNQDQLTSWPTTLLQRASEPLLDYAHATGGEFVADVGKLGDSISRLQQRVRVTYQVSRLPDERSRKIEVRSRRAGLRVSTFQWVSTATPEAVAGARATQLLEGSEMVPELPLIARFKRAATRAGTQPRNSGTIEARVDLGPIGPIRSRLTATTLRITVAVERKGGPPIVRHEIVRGYDAANQPVVDYSAPIEMSNDATKVAIAIEELTSGAWGGAVVDLETGVERSPGTKRRKER